MSKSISRRTALKKSIIGLSGIGLSTLLTVYPTTSVRAAQRSDLNGLRMQIPGNPAIFLIDQGKKRWITNEYVYTNLFRDWDGIVQDIGLAYIDRGPDITNNTLLVQAGGLGIPGNPVWLYDQGVKRWIISPSVMDKYNFSWNTIEVVPYAILDTIPRGINIK